MRLLDLVEQEHAMRMLVDLRRSAGRPGRSRHSPAARRSGARPAWRSMYSDMSKRISSMPSRPRELARHLGLADAGRAGEQIGADRLLRRSRRPGARQLDRRGELARSPCPGRTPRVLRSRVDVAQHLGVVLGHALGRDARDLGDDLLDVRGTSMVDLRMSGGRSIWAAPTSSITSIALSGSLRSWM